MVEGMIRQAQEWFKNILNFIIQNN